MHDTDTPASTAPSSLARDTSTAETIVFEQSAENILKMPDKLCCGDCCSGNRHGFVLPMIMFTLARTSYLLFFVKYFLSLKEYIHLSTTLLNTKSSFTMYLIFTSISMALILSNMVDLYLIFSQRLAFSRSTYNLRMVSSRDSQRFKNIMISTGIASFLLLLSQFSFLSSFFISQVFNWLTPILFTCTSVVYMVSTLFKESLCCNKTLLLFLFGLVALGASALLLQQCPLNVLSSMQQAHCWNDTALPIILLIALSANVLLFLEPCSRVLICPGQNTQHLILHPQPSNTPR